MWTEQMLTVSLQLMMDSPWCGNEGAVPVSPEPGLIFTLWT
jgi:hypothetical protein